MNTLIHIIKTTDDKSSTYINFDIEKNDEDSKVKDDDHIKIPKNKNVFPNGYNPTWPEEFFVIKKVKKYGTIDMCDRRSSWRRNCWNIL